MRKIKDIISKPSEALQAMVDGLLEQDARHDFVVEMDFFGYVGETSGRCFGCAATCAVQKITGVNFTPDDILKRYVNTDIFLLDLCKFENIIDTARCSGNLRMLFFYFGYDDTFFDIDEKLTMANFSLQNHNWRHELPKVTAHIKLLQEAGY